MGQREGGEKEVALYLVLRVPPDPHLPGTPAKQHKYTKIKKKKKKIRRTHFKSQLKKNSIKSKIDSKT